jgi:hypothetical protein
MISDAAFAAVALEVQSRRSKDGVLGEALALYQRNFTDLQASNHALTVAQIEQTLLVSTSVSSVVSVAERQFRDNALSGTRYDRVKASIASFGMNIFIGIITNFLFVVLMLIVYLAAQDTAQSVFRSLGVTFVSTQTPVPSEQGNKQPPDAAIEQRKRLSVPPSVHAETQGTIKQKPDRVGRDGE